MTQARALRIALVGAESTGKSTLAQALVQALQADGHAAVAVPELLRSWCQAQAREPDPAESEAIARGQEAQVDAAVAAGASIVVTDTTALVVAAYGALLFADHPLLQFALARQRGYDLTLLAGLDLPWVDDGLHRAGPRERAAMDALLRQLLAQAGAPYRVVYGSGEARVRNALAPVQALLGQARHAPERWTHACEACGDPACERRLFSRLRARA